MSLRQLGWIDDLPEKLLQQEKTILDATELISKIMENRDITSTQLAKDMEMTEEKVAQLLDGEVEMTLRMLSDIVFHLGGGIQFRSYPL